MARRHDNDSLIEFTFKYPLFGIIAGIFLGGIGLFLRSKATTSDTKPIATIFNATYLQLGALLCWGSGIMLLISAIGFIWQYFRKRERGF